MSLSQPDSARKSFVKNEGFVAIARSIRDHAIVGFGQPVKPADPSKGAYSRGEAFIDLIMACNYKPGKIFTNGRWMEIAPGQVVGAVSWLAARWNWTPKTVRYFLERLSNDGTISVQTETKRGKQPALISLCNYFEYQLNEYVNGQSKGEQRASKGQAEGNILTREQINKETTKDSLAFASAHSSDREISVLNGSTPAFVEKIAQDAKIDLGTAHSVVEQIVEATLAGVKKAKKEKAADAEKRATRLPKDWTIKPETLAWTVEHYVITQEQALIQADRFKKYWLAAGGKNARKNDWGQAWSNWIGRDHKVRNINASSAIDPSIVIANSSKPSGLTPEEHALYMSDPALTVDDILAMRST